MHTKIEIKEEDPLSEDVVSQNDTEFFTSNVAIKTESNVVLLDNDCDMTIKMEIKSESPLPDFQLKKIDIDEETLVPDFGSQEESGFLQKNPVTKLENYNSDDEVDNKSEIKRDYCWLETETSSICDEIKEDDLSAVKFSRSCIEAVSGDGGKSPLCSAEDLREDVSIYMVKDSSAHGHSRRSEVQGSNAMVNHSVENIHSKQSVNHNNRGKSYMKASYLNEKNVTHETKGSHKCEVCEKRFTHLSSLRRHNLIHAGTKPHKCEICEKRFTQLAHLKNHKLIHEDKKPHKCAVCEKRFTELSNLKRHNLIHEGKKPHKCEACEKRFTRLSHLINHKLIHDDKKPHKCTICDKRFTEVSNLKKHSVTHEAIKPHKCEVCEKRFTRLSRLIQHKLIHDDQKPHKCAFCEKRFTELSNLKKHKLTHDGKKPH